MLVFKNTGTCKVFNDKSTLMCMCVFRFFFDITEATEDKFTWDHNGTGEKNYSNGSGILYSNFVCPWGRGLLEGILPQIWPGSAGLLAGL